MPGRCTPRGLRYGARLLPAIGAVALASLSSLFAQGFGGTVGDTLVRGDSLLAQKRYGEAIVQFQEARTLCPTPAEMVHALQGEAVASIQQGELLPAVGLLEEAVTRYPDDPRAADLLYAAGQALYRGGEFDRAIDTLRKALDHNPTPDIVPGIRYQLAQALRRRGRPAEAVEVLKDFDTSYPQHPLLPNALYLVAIASHDIPDLTKAEEVYRELIEKFPGRPAATEAQFELGLVLSEEGKNAEAVEAFRAYVAQSPGSPYAAKALERAGDAQLFRSPKESAELYALAVVKAGVNPKPDLADMQPGRFIGGKRMLAEALSRLWAVGLVSAAVLACAAWLVMRLRRGRRRRTETAPAA